MIKLLQEGKESIELEHLTWVSFEGTFTIKEPISLSGLFKIDVAGLSGKGFTLTGCRLETKSKELAPGVYRFTYGGKTSVY